MSGPVIGISTYREPASWLAWEQIPAVLLPVRYVDAVRAGGGIPVLLPPLGPGDDAGKVAGRLDGLVIAGGADVNPPATASIHIRRRRGGATIGTCPSSPCSTPPTTSVCRCSESAAACR